MEKEQYNLEENIATSYGESFNELPDEKYSYLKKRGYDIIRTIEKDGLLFVGLNPSFNENIQEPEGSVIYEATANGSSKTGGYNYNKYFGKLKKMNDAIGICGFSHIDLFTVRTSSQKIVEEMWSDDKCSGFVEAQIQIFRKIIEGAEPRMIIVINAFASSLIEDCIFLNDLFYEDSLGVDIYKLTNGKLIPVFFSGMLTGAHALDNGSYKRLVWHVKYVKEKMNL